MCITRFHIFCINEGFVLVTNAKESQGNGHGFITSDIYESSTAGKLSHQSLERPSFN